MTDGEKRIADLLENLTKHVFALRGDLAWFRQREQAKLNAIQKLAVGLPKVPKTGG